MFKKCLLQPFCLCRKIENPRFVRELRRFCKKFAHSRTLTVSCFHEFRNIHLFCLNVYLIAGKCVLKSNRINTIRRCFCDSDKKFFIKEKKGSGCRRFAGILHVDCRTVVFSCCHKLIYFIQEHGACYWKNRFFVVAGDYNV